MGTKNKHSFKPGNKAAVGHGRPKLAVLEHRERFKWDVKSLCEAHDFQPFEELIRIAKFDRSVYARLEAASQLAAYLVPKLKSIEIKGDEKKPFIINMNLSPNKEKDG
jgi:hypothetical protein